jgi:hypothetical protein
MIRDFHYVLESAQEEICHCRKPAYHKVEEVMEGYKDPGQIVRHPFTTYLCCDCFSKLMGSFAKKVCDDWHNPSFDE